MEPLVHVVTFDKKQKKTESSASRKRTIPVLADDRSLSEFHAAFELDLWSRPDGAGRHAVGPARHRKQAR